MMTSLGWLKVFRNLGVKFELMMKLLIIALTKLYLYNAYNYFPGY